MSRHVSMTSFALALVVAACATTSPAPTAPPGSTLMTPVDSPSALAAPLPSAPSSTTPSPSQQAVMTTLPEGGSNVFPGRYSTRFEPALLLTIDRQVEMDCAPGYRCRGDVDVNSPHWLDMEFGHDHPVELHVMSFNKLFDWVGGLVDPPADLSAWISGLPGITVLAKEPTDVGGVPATQLDVRTGSNDVAFGPTDTLDLPTLGFGPEQFHRVIIVARDGAAVIFGFGSIYPEDNTYDRLAVAADILQPIVDSITWQ